MKSHSTYQHPEVFFHTGLGKVASKYFQFQVFPYFKNVRYIPTKKFFRSVPEINKGMYPSYIVSREFDTTLKEEVGKFAIHFPDAHPILMLRRHDEWITSQYKRFLKNGYRKSFTEFIDLDNDQGRFDIDSLNFYGRIEFLENTFSHAPLVMIYDDLVHSPWEYIDRVAYYCGATYNKADIRTKPMHQSYSDKQLRFMQRISRVIPVYSITYSSSRLVRKLLRPLIYLFKYFILYLALIIPGKWIGDYPLIQPEDLERIRAYTAKDWEACLDYVARNHGDYGLGG